MKSRSSNGPYIKRPKYNQDIIDQLLSLSKQTTSVKQKNRYDTVILYLKNYEQKEIAEILHTPQRTISAHIRTFCTQGIEALLLKKAPGAKKKLTNEQEKELVDIISTHTPAEAGIGVFANWTGSLICKLIKEKYNVTFNEKGIFNLLYRLGLSCTRPTYVLKKADPEKQAEFLKIWEAVKKTDT